MASDGSALSQETPKKLDEVYKILEHAKLDRSELKSTSQLLSFSSDVADRDLLLLELDSKLLDCLANGKNLTFRGEKEDHAVLCTADTTYSVKEATTSNSLLLLEDLTFPESIPDHDEMNLVSKEIVGVHHKYLEVTLCRPRFDRVKQLLKKCPFKGIECEDNYLDSPKFTFENLMDRIQSSEEELHLCLKEIEAYNIDGFCRLLDVDYNFRLITQMTNLVLENSWSFASIPKSQMLDTLASLEPRYILEQCMDHYGNVTNDIDDNGDVLYRFDENKVCRLFAKMVLVHKTEHNLNEFCASWKQSVPDGMTTNLEQLKGLAMIDHNSTPPAVIYLPVLDLPEDINERLNALFKMKPKWTLEEIDPYIRCLTTPKLDVNGLLTKYTRVSMVKGVRYYSSRNSRR